LSSAFEDVEQIAQQCKFHDCSHHHELGCAIKVALLNGSLDGGRFYNYQKTLRELAPFISKGTRRTLDKEKGRNMRNFVVR
jgi:ribosome biogenesis GTPase